MMYCPEAFAEHDHEKIAELIRQHPFGMMITTESNQPFVTHLPLVFEPSAPGKGKVIGHMARANDQWQHLADNQDVLIIFQGPHCYVSPSWYDSPGVPTWNYAVVHLKGKARLIEDEAGLEAMLTDLTERHEAVFDQPWQLTLTADKREKLFSMIVGFEIDVMEISAKFKMSQNRAESDRTNVITHLETSTNHLDKAVAEMMKSMH